MPIVFYRTLNVEGLEIFYREAGPWDAPTVLLLHGFPSSSYMFRNLISPMKPFCLKQYSLCGGTYEFKNLATHREWDRDCPSVRTVCARSFLSIRCG
jgi:pimeloyl-ACP methyl ester carboxylesterase